MRDQAVAQNAADETADRYQIASFGGYHVQWVRTANDLAKVMALRRARFGVGEDRFDEGSTQVMISQGNDVVATFRLRLFENGAAITQGYSGQFYDLRALADMPRPALELGRFCVAEGAAQVDALRLSFAAMAAQVDRYDAGLLFGCASFHGCDLGLHRPALSLLKAHIGTKWPIGCLAPQYVPLASLTHTPQEQAAAMRALPPLLRTYLSLGGWVGPQAVRDEDLGTYHVFTALNVDDIPPARAAALRAMAKPMGPA